MNSGAIGRLVYDADCKFCSRVSHWMGPSVAWQELDLVGVGATVQQVTTAAGWLEGGTITAWGAPAIAAALVQRGGAAAVAGRAQRLPVVRLAADPVYRWVANNRHLMPGGTAACATRPVGPSRAVMVAAFSAILLVGLLSLAAANRGVEPYPALIMPGFGSVPESGGTARSTEAVYTLVMSDGSSRSVSPRALLSGHAGYVAALRTLADPAATRDPETAAWLRSNLGPAADGAVQLRVDWHTISYDTHTRERHDQGVARTLTVDLEDIR